MISGSRAIVTGAPFDSGKDSPLWADAKTKVAKLQSSGKVTAAEAQALLADARTSLLSIKPGYDRVIAWAQSELPTAPSGRVGAISLPGGAEWYAAALKLNTTLPLTAEQIHQTGLEQVKAIEAEQDKLARSAGFKDRDAFYADRAKRFPPQPWTDALRADYLARANAAIAHNRSLLPERFYNLPQYRAEVRRYITLPGQATGYKIGQLKIFELRRKAEAALGPKFDIKAFDDLIISNGSQPLPVLERRVDEWVASRKS